MAKTDTAADAHVGNSAKSGLIGKTGLEKVSTQDIYRELLRRYDADPTRDGLERTPERMEKAIEFLTKGYGEDPAAILRAAMFDVAYDEMVIVKDIEMYSVCEHHLVPFHGVAHVGYLPGARIIGLSKLARVVEHFAAGLQVQERLTTQIAQTLMSEIDPLGVAVGVGGEHLCLRMGGGAQRDSYVTTPRRLGGVSTTPKTGARAAGCASRAE